MVKKFICNICGDNCNESDTEGICVHCLTAFNMGKFKARTLMNYLSDVIVGDEK